MVGESGFEPLKSSTTDLQSAPFGHSGTLPYLIAGDNESYHPVEPVNKILSNRMELVNGLEPLTC